MFDSIWNNLIISTYFGNFAVSQVQVIIGLLTIFLPNDPARLME